MTDDDLTLSSQVAKPASASRMSLAVITHPGQANAFGTLHGGVILRLADECGAIVSLRHAGGGRITTAALDSMIFLGPVYPGERVELDAEVTFVGRSSIETRITVYAEPLAKAERRKVGEGYGLYVALDDEGRPRAVPPLPRAEVSEAAKARQAVRLERRDEAKRIDLLPLS